MHTPNRWAAPSFSLTAALLALSTANIHAFGLDGSRRELLQAADASLGAIPNLLKSIHCFREDGVVSISGTDWEPATSFLASGNEITHKAVENTPEDTSNTTRPVSIITNNLKQGSDYNIGLSGQGGDTVELKTPQTSGLLELRIVPLSELPAVISGIQILSAAECSQSAALDTTGESDSEGDAAVLVYRMACSSLLPQADTIFTDLDAASSPFINQQKDFVARMGDAASHAQLFTSLCLPAVDADHLEITLPLRDKATFEVILYFTKPNTQAWSDILVTVDGHDVFADTRLKFKPGPGEDPAYLMKRFEVRAGPDGVKLVVSSRNGFPPISGLEAWQITAKSASVGMTLLDRPDDRIVVACASKVFKQTPKGEILYPGPQAFTSAGLQIVAISATIAPDNPDLVDLLQGGAFLGACQKAEGQTITATFKVEQGQPYTVSFFWVEFEDGAATGSRVMSINVDGIAVASGVDIFKDVGQNTAVGFAAPVTAIDGHMTVTIKAEVGKPMISAIALDGPGVDAAAADKHDVNQVTGLSKAAACGAPGPEWDPIEGITAAGFKKFTAEQEINNVEGELQALYATHCFAVDGGTITMQLPVVPKARLRVVLHFAEVFFEERGLRTFDVVVNGVPQFKQLDIVAEAGAFAPLVKEFTFVPAGPTLVIELVSVVDNALINGIEIYSREVINTQEAGSATPAADPAAAPAAAPTPAAPMVEPPTGPPCIPPEDIVQQTGVLGMEPGAIGFGEIAPQDLQGNFAPLRLSNRQAEAVGVAAVSCTPLEGMQAVTSTFFVVQFGAAAGSLRVQCGAPGEQVPVDPAFIIPGGQDRITTALFEPTELLEAAATLTMHGVDGVLGSIVVTGTGGDPWAKAHTLHPVIDGDTVFAEPDEFGGATILIDGSTSHTHAPGRKMATFLWEDASSAAVIGKDQVLQCWYPFGTYTVSLTVTDNAMEAAATSMTVVVAPESRVPGTLLQVYEQATSLDPLPQLPTMAHMATAPFMSVLDEQPEFGPFLVRMLAEWYHPGGAAKMAATGAPAGTQPWIGIDGEMIQSAAFERPEGTYLLDVRLLLPEPANVQITLDGGPISSSVSDISKHPPIINELSTDATARPGNIGLVKGFLLQSPATISVGGILANITEHERSSIAFTYPELPPGNHSITVDRNGLISNPIPVELLEASAGGGTEQGGPFADTPKYTQKAVPVDVPARLAWCHGKLYVASAYAVANSTGRGIIEFTFDSNYEVVDQRLVIATPQPFPPANEKMAWSILGLACDPRDDDRTFKLYFTLSPLYTQGGEPPKLPAPYYGKVMYVQPAAAAPKAIPVVDNISTSNGDHVVNGIDFLHDGRLLIAVGSQTNAGIEGALGLLPDNPTCTNLLVADVQNPDFNGVLAYELLPGAPATHTDPNDQRFGDWVTQTNDYVKYYATGTRNPYDVRVGRKGNVMVTINGPNFKFGATLTGVDAQLAPVIAPDPETDDAIWLDLKEGCHCGAPNIARCRAGAKHECFYIGMDDLEDDFPTQCPPDTIMTSAIGGMTEYHSYVFGGVSHDKVFVAGYKKHLVRYDPIGDKQVTDKDDAFYPPSPGLDVIHAPGGVHIVASMEASKLLVNIPVDATVAASGTPSVYDIKPDRGMQDQPGPNTFVLGGANFDAIQGVPKVLFGDVPANKVAVAGPGWITGHIPPSPEGTCDTDIVLQFGAITLTLPEAFCYIAA